MAFATHPDETKGNPKEIQAVRFKESVEDQSQVKERGLKSGFYLKNGKPFVHPPHKLINGAVVYRCKVLGSMLVTQTQGTNLVREVVDKLKLVAEVRKDNIKEKIVDVGIYVRFVYVQDVEKKTVLARHPLHQISYCAEDRRFDDIFAYIIRNKKKDKPAICYVYKSLDSEAAEIAATVGQAFQLAYTKFQDTKAAQMGFKDMKEKLISDLDKADFAKQVVELQEKVKEMEDANKPAKDESTEKFPEVVAQWESITTALEPFSGDLDPEIQHLVARPETSELDKVIGNIEEEVEELQEAFSDQWFLLERLTGRESEKGLTKEVMKDIDKQVQEMMVETKELGEVPVHYQSREFQMAKERALMPEIGMVRNKKSQWEKRAQN